jgi:hydroxymethylbilane synthase
MPQRRDRRAGAMTEAVLRVGTRASALALWQTNHVIGALERAWPRVRGERVPIRTLGDRVKDVPLPRIGDRGLFTREIEAGLRERVIDIAVHSLKDLPTEDPEDLIVGAVLEREDPRDALVSQDGCAFAALPARARVGTSSIRRRAQLLAMRSDLAIVDIRGNVPTRLEKVARGDYDATVLALAGLRRLELTDKASDVFALTQVLPAPGQGALAVQVRTADDDVRALVSALDHQPTRWATDAERGVLAMLEGGCQAPVGALATWSDDGILRLDAVVADFDGARVCRQSAQRGVTSSGEARALAAVVARQLREQGADALIAACREAVGTEPASRLESRS